jgi:hypothetical protein
LLHDGHEGVTRYRFRVWGSDEAESSDWLWEVDQKSPHALRKGGMVLLAHHVDVTFGAVSIVPVPGKGVKQNTDIKNK